MQKHSGIESSINSLRASLNNKKGFEIEEAKFIILKANDEDTRKISMKSLEIFHLSLNGMRDIKNAAGKCRRN